jgi:hypothetical protein
MRDDEPTREKLEELKRFLERSLAQNREEKRRARKNAGVCQPWVDAGIDKDIKRDCYKLAFVDQVIASGVIK